MSKLNILVLGKKGFGKSTAARICKKALQKAGFDVEFEEDSKEAVLPLDLKKCNEALKKTTVKIYCGEAKVSKYD